MKNLICFLDKSNAVTNKSTNKKCRGQHLLRPSVGTCDLEGVQIVLGGDLFKGECMF